MGAIFCSPECPLSEVLDKMVHHKIHRVFVVNELHQPIGVITTTSIMQRITKPGIQFA
jgi:CBS domain containing-hemolysin-like protein